MMITLTNNFHGTSVNLRPRNGRLSPAQMRRARKVLCGLSECQCGGIRGPQEFEIDREPDGGAKVDWDLRLVRQRLLSAVDGDIDREADWLEALDQLREIYRKAGEPWEVIAGRLGVAPSTLYGWLDGRHEPSPLARNAIAGLYHYISTGETTFIAH